MKFRKVFRGGSAENARQKTNDFWGSLFVGAVSYQIVNIFDTELMDVISKLPPNVENPPKRIDYWVQVEVTDSLDRERDIERVAVVDGWSKD